MRGLLVFVLLGGVLGFACHEEQGVSYENSTTTTVRVIIDDFELATFGSGESRTFGVRESLTPDRVRAFDQAGTLVFDRTYTWDDLKSLDWRVVITADDGPNVSPTPDAEQTAVSP